MAHPNTGNDTPGTITPASETPPRQGTYPFVSERIAIDQVEQAFTAMRAGDVLRSVVVL